MKRPVLITILMALGLSAQMAAAQEPQAPPLFPGSSSSASSARVDDVFVVPEGAATAPARPTAPFLEDFIGAAIDEAARERGRIFVQERYKNAPVTSSD
ncbi:hypothetical protein [uncultured Roseobacter sp.]|uniref:hypothetical protein n=1 Tax=uncultured Roseobacter sp. TaxID=114847 RepID=UPI0026203B2B|nr:hypothetical protein [uncultured Roseobacter sp.]